MDDPSNGWEAAAEEFMRLRSGAGTDVVRRWARSLPEGASVLDIGCGHGEPLTRTLVEEGLDVFALDPSPTMAAAFRQRLPGVPVACEAAETSTFFERSFDAVLAVGLLFLLSEERQQLLLRRVAGRLRPKGRLLFSAPEQKCSWEDLQTGRASQSMGKRGYELALKRAGMQMVGQHRDESGNDYFEARLRGSLPATP